MPELAREDFKQISVLDEHPAKMSISETFSELVECRTRHGTQDNKLRNVATTNHQPKAIVVIQRATT
jgi:hypothetical protein